MLSETWRQFVMRHRAGHVIFQPQYSHSAKFFFVFSSLCSMVNHNWNPSRSNQPWSHPYVFCTLLHYGLSDIVCLIQSKLMTRSCYRHLKPTIEKSCWAIRDIWKIVGWTMESKWGLCTIWSVSMEKLTILAVIQQSNNVEKNSVWWAVAQRHGHSHTRPRNNWFSTKWTKTLQNGMGFILFNIR